MSSENRVTNTRERIGIFGGTFDPPHLGHLVAASFAAGTCRLDRVVWVPSGEPYHKDTLTPASIRAELTEAAIADDNRFHLSTVDLERTGPTFTVDTLQELTVSYGDARFTLIMGEDSWESFEQWREPDRIRRMADIAIVSRRHSLDSAELPSSPDDSVTWVGIPHIGISSSMCRERVRQGGNLKYVVPDAVAELIYRHNLYREGQ